MSIFFEKPEGGIKKTFTRRHTREPLRANANNGSGRKRIGFVGLAAGTGATTLCFAAAEYLAVLSESSVTMLELDLRPDAPAGTPYDKVGIDRRFAGRDFFSLYRLAAEGKPLAGVCNIDGGINWVLRFPGEPGSVPDPTTLHRLVNNVSGDIVLCDISAPGILNYSGSNKCRDTLKAILADLDHIVCIFDPLPSRLLASVPAAEVCRAAAAAGVPVTYIINKFNPGVNVREVTRFTGLRDYLPFPAIPAEDVYAAEYACRSLAGELTASLSCPKLFERITQITPKVRI